MTVQASRKLRHWGDKKNSPVCREGVGTRAVVRGAGERGGGGGLGWGGED